MVTGTLEALSEVSNDSTELIKLSQPYAILAEVNGTTPILFKRWSVEAVETKAKASKGSAAKKTDDLESYVYRMPTGELAIPAEYFRMSLVNAAKFKQDPRSPRKSAMDITKAAIACLEPLCSLNTKKWDFVDQRRVQFHKNSITRSRPALNTGWKVQVILQVLLPEYISPQFLNELLQDAGRLIGVGDFRPSYGRFAVTRFKVL